MFSKVLFRCENVGRQRDFANFWHFYQWIESFFNSVEFLCLNKVNWMEKRLNSCEKMSKIGQIMLSADIFTRKLNVGRQRDLANFGHFHQWIESFSTLLTLLRLNNSIGLKKDWNHVRKCQKFAKSCCRPTFSQRNKTLENIPLCFLDFEERKRKNYHSLQKINASLKNS